MDENKNKTELNDEQLEKVSGGAVANDGKCGHSVPLQNGRCTVTPGKVENPCVGCKYF